MSPYHVLGVSPDADLAALRASYRKLARVHHPDCAPDERARVVAAERMVKINWAWHIVSDAKRRAAYDASFRLEQIEAARRQQDALRAQARGQAVRGQQAHMADILKAQAAQRQEQNRRIREQQIREQQMREHRAQNWRGTAGEPDETARQTSDAQTPPASERPSSAQQGRAQAAREQQFLEWQALERERHEREKRAKMNAQTATRSTRKQLSREEKKRQILERARLRQMRREDKRRSELPSARRRLSEASRLFAQEGRAGDAIAICHDVLRTDGRNVPARELLGDFYLCLGRQDRALPLLEQALALQPDNSSVRRKLSALRPHDPASYRAQPRPPRPQPARINPQYAARDGFWNRVRHAFLSGL